MKISYVSPKGRKKKKDIKLCSFSYGLTSLFFIKDPTLVTLIIFDLLLITMHYSMQLKQQRADAAKEKEDAYIKKFDREQKLQKIADSTKDKRCENVSVKNLL